MLDAANEALSFAEGKSMADIESDRMLALSLIKEIEIIGEAARTVSEEFKANNPQLPWYEIVGMRHHLIHVYFDVDLGVLWSTVTRDLPQLVRELEKIHSDVAG